MKPHRRDGNGYAVDPLDSSTQGIGDRLSKQWEPIHNAKEERMSYAIHGSRDALWGKGIKKGFRKSPIYRKYSFLANFTQSARTKMYDKKFVIYKHP